MSKRRSNSIIQLAICTICLIALAVCTYYNFDVQRYFENIIDKYFVEDKITTSFDLASIPEYTDQPYVIINNNIPHFTEEDYTLEAFENYSELDKLGRCGVAFANICRKTMPKQGEERGEIGMIKPSGWKTARYDGLVDQNYLYNRCHLIAWSLAGENANEKNLITGTRYFNKEGMLPFENSIHEYLQKKGNKNNHVLYRVTPIFEGKNLVASGVQMEAYSVEDNGEGICYNVYVYNVQPGIEIDYRTGKSKLIEES